MTPDIQKRIDTWLSAPEVDVATKEEIRHLQKTDPEALIDAFFSTLSFGTGGMRGLMGVGSNRMNVYTVRRATHGLASYIRAHGNPQAGVIIGFDNRLHSQTFAEEAARVLAAHNIKVYLFEEMRPTPFISFACRFQHCQAALMITASHNPKEYNGYKVYWRDGAQVLPPHDTGILEEIEKNGDFSAPLAPKDSPFIHFLKDELDISYYSALYPLQHFPKQNKEKGKELVICYTSLHGTGITLMPQALAHWGFTQCHLVEKQVIPDPAFSTIRFPNPEYPETFQLGLEKMKEKKGDLLLVTDPDADRLGIAVRHQEEIVLLSGNQIASICAYFLCSLVSPHASSKDAIITTIVTTELLKKIAKAFDKSYVEVLTGFKYIGEKIHQWETSSHPYHFLFGAEESYGYLIGTHARDKDGIVIGCLLAEIALHLKLQGKTLVDYLYAIYQHLGVFQEKQLSLSFPAGPEGVEASARLMRSLRSSPPATLGGQKVEKIIDLAKESELSLPLTDVLLFYLTDGSKVVIRPSGTEPKVKIYLSTHEKGTPSVQQGMKVCEEKLNSLERFLSMLLSS